MPSPRQLTLATAALATALAPVEPAGAAIPSGVPAIPPEADTAPSGLPHPDRTARSHGLHTPGPLPAAWGSVSHTVWQFAAWDAHGYDSKMSNGSRAELVEYATTGER